MNAACMLPVPRHMLTAASQVFVAPEIHSTRTMHYDEFVRRRKGALLHLRRCRLAAFALSSFLHCPFIVAMLDCKAFVTSFPKRPIHDGSNCWSPYRYAKTDAAALHGSAAAAAHRVASANGLGPLRVDRCSPDAAFLARRGDFPQHSLHCRRYFGAGRAGGVADTPGIVRGGADGRLDRGARGRCRDQAHAHEHGPACL